MKRRLIGKNAESQQKPAKLDVVPVLFHILSGRKVLMKLPAFRRVPHSNLLALAILVTPPPQ